MFVIFSYHVSRLSRVSSYSLWYRCIDPTKMYQVPRHFFTLIRQICNILQTDNCIKSLIKNHNSYQARTQKQNSNLLYFIYCITRQLVELKYCINIDRFYFCVNFTLLYYYMTLNRVKASLAVLIYQRATQHTPHVCNYSRQIIDYTSTKRYNALCPTLTFV